MAIRENVTLDEAIAFLNEIRDLDPRAVQLLIEQRVQCNKRLAEHESVQVVGSSNDWAAVGLLGILNGLFGIHDEGSLAGSGPITAFAAESGVIFKFGRSDQTDRKLKT